MTDRLLNAAEAAAQKEAEFLERERIQHAADRALNSAIDHLDELCAIAASTRTRQHLEGAAEKRLIGFILSRAQLLASILTPELNKEFCRTCGRPLWMIRNG